jgi:phage repressor protein C with HTH and peptisase S24 domain
MSTFNLNSNWLLTGEGDMFINQPGSQDDKEISADYKVPLIRQNVSCGSGESWQTEDNIEKYLSPLELVPGLLERKPAAFHVRGLSMTGAGIYDGDIVLFDSREGQDATDDIYVFALDGDVYCKLLKIDLLQNAVRIYSMHSADVKEAELVKVLKIDDNDFVARFHVMGRVIAWLHKNRLIQRD